MKAKKFLEWVVDLEDNRSWVSKGNTNWNALAYLIWTIYIYCIKHLGDMVRVTLGEEKEEMVIEVIVYTLDTSPLLPQDWNKKVAGAERILKALTDDKIRLRIRRVPIL